MHVHPSPTTERFCSKSLSSYGHPHRTTLPHLIPDWLCRGDVRFPRDMYTTDDEFLTSRRIIRDLLEPNVLKRLGCQKRGMLDIKDAEFFAGVRD